MSTEGELSQQAKRGRRKTERGTEIDYLTEDKPIQGQVWYCVSFLSPEGVRNCSVRGLKIRGVYATEQEARERAKELEQVDPDFHVFVGEVGKWCPWDPNPDTCQDSVYQNDELNNLMKEYKKNRQQAQKAEQERKAEMIKENIATQRKAGGSHEDRIIETRERLARKLAEKREKQNTEALSNTNKSARGEELKAKREEINKESIDASNADKKIEDSERKLKNVEDNLNRLKALLKK